jgi:CDP-diacylglycerol---glycerol-3-phosphate 3-phosphatidyltransferase
MSERSLVPPTLRARIRAAAVPFAVAMGRIGLTPNALTVIGFLGVCVSAVLAGMQAWVAAGAVSLAFAAFDLLDGSLARATGRVSKFGGFLDSTLDRAGEGVMYVGITVGALSAGQTALAAAAAAAMVPAFMVSYTRARAEGLGFSCEVGIAPRAERVVITGIGLLATGIAGGIAPPVAAATAVTSGLAFAEVGGSIWLAAMLGLLIVMTTITVLQRIAHVRTVASRAEEH